MTDKAEKIAYPEKDVILVVGEAPGITDTLVTALKEEGFHVKQIFWRDAGLSILSMDHYKSVLFPEENPEKIVSKICSSGERIGGIVNLAGFDAFKASLDNISSGVFGFFTLLKTFEKDLKASALEGGGSVFTVTPLGGQFGISSLGVCSPEAAGAIGITKSIGLEWPSVKTRCIDMDPNMDADRIAAHLLEEIVTRENRGEVGINQEGRWHLSLEEYVSDGKSADIQADSVILLFGGASGITGEIGKEMARKYQPNLILVGRSSVMEKEPDETGHLLNEAVLRSYFINSAKDHGEAPTPARINGKIAELLKQRQLAANIKAMRDAGAKVEYHALDVRRFSTLETRVEDIYRRYGRIDGVVHGAGIIDDHLVHDKTLASFKRVYETKVVPAQVLSEKLQPDGLKFLVFFSSVAGRFGNIGQCDYSAANEVLNKYAHLLAKKWPQTRVVSIGWGPWEAGMVNEDLKRFYLKHDIGLIPVEQGVDLFFDQIAAKPENPVEMIAAADIHQMGDNGLGRFL